MPNVCFTEPTSGAARGYVQCNIVILPADIAELRGLLSAEPKPCPLLAISPTPGDPVCRRWEPTSIFVTTSRATALAEGALAEHRLNIAELWRDDFVAFALGCSFLLRRRC